MRTTKEGDYLRLLHGEHVIARQDLRERVRILHVGHAVLTPDAALKLADALRSWVRTGELPPDGWGT